MFARHPSLLVLVPFLPLLACVKQVLPRDTSTESDEPTELDIAVCDASAGPFSLVIDNAFLPFVVGTAQVLEDEDGEERVRISVLDETEVVSGVVTRVVEEREWESGALAEVSRNFFAQAPDGTVCYFGEDVDEYEGGEVVRHEGAWRAGQDSAKPGILMPADPGVGMAYAQEVAPGVAEDRGEIIAMGDTVETPAGTFTDTVTVRETSPLDAGSSLKHYARGVGMIYDDGIALIVD